MGTEQEEGGFWPRIVKQPTFDMVGVKPYFYEESDGSIVTLSAEKAEWLLSVHGSGAPWLWAKQWADGYFGG